MKGLRVWETHGTKCPQTQVGKGETHRKRLWQRTKRGKTLILMMRCCWIKVPHPLCSVFLPSFSYWISQNDFSVIVRFHVFFPKQTELQEHFNNHYLKGVDQTSEISPNNIHDPAETAQLEIQSYSDLAQKSPRPSMPHLNHLTMLFPDPCPTRWMEGRSHPRLSPKCTTMSRILSP